MTIKADILKAPEVTDASEGYLDTLIEQAKALILEYTKIADDPDEWPEDDANLDAACVRLALSFYRRGGAEGVQSLGVGDISPTFSDIPPEVQTILNGRRRTAWF